ncbi:MAG: Major phosphate-irrepressible acid phosphatase precursor [Pseudomonadota bacterium]|jgi:acid phosphatase (class A)
MTKIRTRIALAAIAATLAGCQTPPPTSPEAVGEYRKGSGYLNGYLDRKQHPDSLALLPPAPAPGSARAAADLDAHRAARALRDGPRGVLARQDVNLAFPAAAETFSCALDLPISQEQTPHLNMLLRRTLVDAGLATYAAKEHYKRQRPYTTLGEPTCEPSEEQKLSKDGSYPSGHAALGWTWALVLAEVAPDRLDRVLARGREFGQSRVVCGYHWQSDVDAGREVGAAAFARLQSNETFRAQIALAKTEVAAARARGLRPTRDCAAEATALRAR